MLKTISAIYPQDNKNSELPEMTKNFQNCKGIIIDFRCYPSDFIIYSLSEYLMPDSTINLSNSLKQILKYYGMFFLEDYRTVGKNNPNYFKGKVVLLLMK